MTRASDNGPLLMASVRDNGSFLMASVRDNGPLLIVSMRDIYLFIYLLMIPVFGP